MTYFLGRRSLRELRGVHPQLVTVVKHAISITTQDFSVHDGLRTLKEQEEYMARGVSQTLNSKHLPQPDGHGHAVDLVPYINGKLRWEWDAIYPIAEAIKATARSLGVPIRWGGCWLRLDDAIASPTELVDMYVAMKKTQGKKAFIDGPHYELLL